MSIKDSKGFKWSHGMYVKELNSTSCGVIKNFLDTGMLDSNIVAVTGENLFGFISDDSDGYIPSEVYNEQTEEYEEINLLDELGPHLADGWVAVIMEIGAEKARYLTGIAKAINNKGEVKELSLTDIYNMAKELGSNVSHAEY